MPFPNTIDATVGGAEQPGKFSTFYHGTDKYQIQFVLSGATAQLVAEKSTDGGLTWAAVGSGPIALAQPLAIPYTCCQVGPLLYVIYVDLLSGGFVGITTFDMSSDTWGSLLATTLPPFNFASLSFYQFACSYRPSTGDILLVLPGDRVTLDDVGHTICAFCVFSIAGGTWGSWVDLGYQDYLNITSWDMVPCGVVTDAISGRTTVVMQQVTTAGPGDFVQTQVPTAGPFSIAVPLDVDPASGQADLWGAGGGGNPGDDVGSGGGGGEETSGGVTLTPGGTLTGAVGAGGASGADGTATTCQSLTANPGLAGISGASQPGGAGGTGGGGHAGGDGGASDASGLTGSGGGGSATAGAPGGNGQSGDGTTGGAGGIGQGAGGAGGNGNIFDPPTGGGLGGAPGGGGGGHGVADLTTPGGNSGADGQFNVTWQLVRNTNNCRMWQQTIHADNSLGTLTEIPAGAFPARAKNALPIPISFDMAMLGTALVIAFTGATSTADKDNISVGKGVSADPVIFSFQTFSSGNGGNGVDSSPAVAMAPGITYCCYISSPADIHFVYRTDSGSGFGSPTTLGTLTAPDLREFGRLQASATSTALDVTFGTPTIGSTDFSNLE